MSRPGVMLYFSILPALDSLPPASAGTLLLAAMHYAQDGKEPIFDDGALAFAWAFLKPMIEKDGEAYDGKKQRGEWLTYCRKCKQDNVSPLDFEAWRERTVTEPLQPDTDTTPITITNTIPITIPVTNTISNNNMGADKPPTPTKAPKNSYGEFGWVKLTNDEFNRLSNDLGEAEVRRCITYVDESAQTTGNKNKWKDWNLVIRKCHNQGWGLNHQKGGNNGRFAEDAVAQYGHIGTVL